MLELGFDRRRPALDLHRLDGRRLVPQARGERGVADVARHGRHDADPSALHRRVSVRRVGQA